MPYTMNRDEYRSWCRLEKAARKAKDRKLAAQERRACWSQAYWAKALRFQTFKVGGLRFIKVGRLSVSICVTRPMESREG